MKLARPTLADRVVGWFDPVAGAQRLRARSFMALAGSYDGASTSTRAGRRWFTFERSADADLYGELPRLRARSRDQVRNNPIATGAVHTIVSRTVATGLSLQPSPNRAVLGWDEQKAEEWKADVKHQFEAWACSPYCTLDGVGDFYDYQELLFRGVIESGDDFTILASVPDRRWPISLRLQLLEADRVGNPLRGLDTDDTVQGVLFDLATGRRKAFHVYTQHPGNLAVAPPVGRWVQAYTPRGTPAVLHHFRRLRPEQTRGVPHLAPVLEALKQLDRYTEAEIMAAVISGMFTVFVKSDAPEQNPLLAGGEPSSDNAMTSDSEIKLESGGIIGLAPGESIETANPGRPNTAFDPFVKAILDQVAIALELPSEVLLKRFTASYSAARAAMLDAWQFFKGRREWLRKSACQPVYEAWLEEAVAAGLVTAPGFFRDPMLRAAYCQATWVGDSPGSIDPVKEVDAYAKAVELQVITRSRAEMELFGSDWMSTYDQKVRERQMLADGGLLPAPAAGAPMAADPAESEDSAEGGEDPEDPTGEPADDESSEVLPDE